MVVCGEYLVAAGPVNRYTPQEGGKIWILSTEDGRVVKEIDLHSPPVFDGLIAAHQSLYLATYDGKILCFNDANSVEKKLTEEIRGRDERKFQQASSYPQRKFFASNEKERDRKFASHLPFFTASSKKLEEMSSPILGSYQEEEKMFSREGNKFPFVSSRVEELPFDSDEKFVFAQSEESWKREGKRNILVAGEKARKKSVNITLSSLFSLSLIISFLMTIGFLVKREKEKR
jgi:hypothetical protein